MTVNARDHSDVYSALDEYVQEELLAGENRYYIEGHGLQEARKSIQFLTLPPVLTFQLKRFQYDPKKGDMIKVQIPKWVTLT